MDKFKKAEVEDEEEIKVQDYLVCCTFKQYVSIQNILFVATATEVSGHYESIQPLQMNRHFYVIWVKKTGVTLHIYARQVTSAEEKKIIGNAANKNRLRQSNTQDLKETVTAQSNLK